MIMSMCMELAKMTVALPHTLSSFGVDLITSSYLKQMEVSLLVPEPANHFLKIVLFPLSGELHLFQLP